MKLAILSGAFLPFGQVQYDLIVYKNLSKDLNL